MTAIRQWVVFCGLFIVSTSARAEDAVQSQTSIEARERTLLDEGYALRKRGKDAEALSMFRQAFALRSDAKALAQIALAEVALGDWAQGHAHLKQALEHAEHLWIRTNRELLESELNRVAKMTAALTIEVTPPGAQVKLGSRVVGVAPLPAPVVLNPGSTSLDVSLEHHSTYHRTLHLEPGRAYREVIHLPRNAAVASRLELQRAAVDTSEPPSWAASHNPVWIGVAMGGALLSASALVPWAIANQRVRDLQAECTGKTACDFEAGNRAVHRLDVLTNALLFSGIGIASACTALYVTITREPSRADASASTESKTLHVGYRGRF